MYEYSKILSFYKNKKVLVTGHTGFKGSWMCRVLKVAQAEIMGYALEPEQVSLFNLSDTESGIKSVTGDIRDYEKLKQAFDEFKPEIVIHLAAQPIVRESYREPRYTFETNVMGTVNICECVRNCGSVKSFLNVTTDKVYDNKERAGEGYSEEEPLDGYDPYSNSKSCSELVTHSYARSFLKEAGISVSTARAGNVIGGGDFAADRIIPDCIRAALRGENITVRNPYSVRPYQHVLEPVFAYLMIAMEQYMDVAKAGWYNVGPDDVDCVTTGTLTDIFCKAWGDITWENVGNNGPHEAGFLKLNCDKLKRTFGWEPKWNIEQAITKTVEFSRLLDGVSFENAGQTEKSTTQNIDKSIVAAIAECMDRQIMEYMNV